jgi:large subunit ribosomal protein L31
MRKDIHPEYREVLFHDTSVDEYFLVRSTLSTDQTKEYEGKTYPYCVLDISSASHPFYTGKQKLVDTGGRVDKFRKRFGNKTKTAPVAEAAAEEAPSEEIVVEEAITEEVVTEEPIVEEAASEETIVEETSVEETSAEEDTSDDK